MKKYSETKSGFTLIEIMVVFVVIIVLAGMIFRMMGGIGKKNEEAETRTRLEMIANALEEFRAAYGKYPPVSYYPEIGQPMNYEYADEKLWPSGVASQLKTKSANKNIWGEGGRVFTFGLLSFFFPRFNSHAASAPKEFVGGTSTYDESHAINQWYKYNSRNQGTDIGDLRQDLDTSRKILPYLNASLAPDGTVASYGIVEKHWVAREHEGVAYTNMHIYVLDGWERSINYESRPPYDTYRLWSLGQDGKDGTGDDVVAGKE